MSAAVFMYESWGQGRTSSIDSPHPWERAMKRLVGERSSSQVIPYLTQGTQGALRRIGSLPADWDGAGSLAPQAESVANAAFRLDDLCAVAMAAGNWVSPHVSISESGEITFEWWNGSKKLTLYFAAVGMQLLRSWGSDVDEEMDLVNLCRVDEFAPAWAWLQDA